MARVEFLERVAPVIQRKTFERGYQFPSAIIAQAACESSWGDSGLSKGYNNYFGMKAGKFWKGGIVNLKTKEEFNGKYVTLVDGFRTYVSLEEGIDGYFDFIATPRYANLESANSPEQYIHFLKQDGYATSSGYVDLLIKVMYNNELKRFDRNSSCNIDLVARDVIKGVYGNGNERKERLRRAGYSYEEVQRRVNEILKA